MLEPYMSTFTLYIQHTNNLNEINDNGTDFLIYACMQIDANVCAHVTLRLHTFYSYPLG